MSGTDTADRERVDEVKAAAVEMRSRIEQIDDIGLDEDVASALDEVYFALGDLNHACVDWKRRQNDTDE